MHELIFLIRCHLIARLVPYTTLFRSRVLAGEADHVALNGVDRWIGGVHLQGRDVRWRWDDARETIVDTGRDRKSTRLNSSHLVRSYAVFCLKKKEKHKY